MCSCIFLSSTSQKRITENAIATVNNYSHQINNWIENEARRVSDVADEIGFQQYDTSNRDGMYPYLADCINRMPEMYAIYIGEPLKTGVKSKNGQGEPASRKADEVRLYALRGGLTTKMVRTAHFRSHEVFRGDHRLPG